MSRKSAMTPHPGQSSSPSRNPALRSHVHPWCCDVCCCFRALSTESLNFANAFAQKFVLKVCLGLLGLHSRVYSLESLSSFHPCWPAIMLKLFSPVGVFSSARALAIEGVERSKRAVVGALGKNI